MLKRTLAVAVAMLALTVCRASAADPHATVDQAAQGVEKTADHSAGGDHGGHIAGDERLVPIPPSKDTIVSAVWVLIIFLVMMAILYKTAWKNVLAGLKKREEHIRKDIADAEKARAQAEATLKEYNAQLATAESKVRDMLAKAHADAEKLAASIRSRAQAESEEIKDRATRDIEASKEQAINQIYEQAAVIATDIAAKILRRNLNADDQRDLVNRSLEQVQTIGR